MLFPILIIAGLITLIGAFVFGRSVGGSASAGTGFQTPPNSPNASCDDACNQWDRRRSERCILQGDEAAARSTADARRSELGMSLAVAAALLAAAVALAVIPVYGWAASAILFAAAAIASATASFIGGLLQRADADVLRLEQATHEARVREAEARDLILNRCDAATANNCLNRSSPC